MRVIRVDNVNLTRDEAIEIAKQENGYRGGHYGLAIDGRHETYYVVKYTGYASKPGEQYGNKYIKEFKIIFKLKEYDAYCKALW